MGSLSLPAAGTIYVDAQIAIYSTDRHPLYEPLYEGVFLVLAAVLTAVLGMLVRRRLQARRRQP